MADRFFYDIPLVDFKPGTPDVDMNFLKSLADDYRQTVEKADAAKEDIINKLGSLNLHQTFSDDYAQYMKNVETQIDQLDNKYQGKMIDRNYKNELSSMIRNIQNDPNLRYMANTSKELFTYEDMVRTKTDYLEYNDPMLSTYKSVLERQKGTKPRFTATNIYSDVNPNEQIRLIAKDINITEDTEYKFDPVAGTVETIDKKTRTASDITSKMKPVMESFRGTQAGQQLEREAKWKKKPDGSSYTYEELFIDRVNGVSKLLEVNNVKKQLSVNPAKEVELKQNQIDLEAAKLLQDKEQFDKQFAQMVKQAKNDDIIKLQTLALQWQTLGFEVEKFNAEMLAQYNKNGMEAALDLMGKRIQQQKNGMYSPGGSGGGSGGGTGGQALGYNERFQGPGVQAVTPDLPENSYTSRLTESAKVSDARAADIKHRLTSSNIYNDDQLTQIEAYLNSIGTPDQAKLGSNPFTMKYVKSNGEVVVAQGTLEQAMSNDPMLVQYSQAYLEGNRTYKQFEDVLFESTNNFLGKFAADDETLQQWLDNGILTRDMYKSTTYKNAGGYGIDEQKLMEYYGASVTKNKSRRIIEVDAKAINTDYVGPTQVYYNQLESAVNENKPIEVFLPSGLSGTISVQQAKIALAKADQQIYNEIMNSNPYLKEWNKSKTGAVASRFGSQGTIVKGYMMDPKGDDGLSSLETKYTNGLNFSLEGLDLYSTTTGLPYRAVGDGLISETTSTGEATGNKYSYIQPGIIYLDSTGRLAMQVKLYTIDPKSAKQGEVPASIQATLLDSDKSNIQSVFLAPLFANVYGQTVGKGIASFFSDNAKWVANNVSYINTGESVQVPYDSNTSVIKQVDGTYQVLNKSTGETISANSDFQLAEVLSRVDYAATATYTEPQIPTINLDAVGQVQAHIKELDELISDYMKTTNELPKDVTTTTTTSNGTTTTKTANPDLVKQIIFERVFKTAVSDKESGGNPGAVNLKGETLSNGTQLPATNAAGEFQFVPSVWNDKIREWARDYGKGDNYTIYSPTGNGQYDKAGPDYNDFLKDSGFQQYVMNRALEQYISTYNKLPAELRNIVGPSEFSVLAHSIGEPTAKAYYELKAGLKTEDQLTDKQRMLIPIGEKYLEDINKRLGKSKPKSTTQPANGATGSAPTKQKAIVDNKLKDLPKGDKLTMANGQTYTKTEPAGKPNPEIPDWKQQPENTIIDLESDTYLEGIMNDWVYAVKQSMKEGKLSSQYSEEEIDNGIKTYVMNRLEEIYTREEPITVSAMLDKVLNDAIHIEDDDFRYSRYIKAARLGIGPLTEQLLVDLSLYDGINIPWDFLKEYPHLSWVPLETLKKITQADDYYEALKLLAGNVDNMSGSDWQQFIYDFNTLVSAEIEKEKNSK